MKYRADIDGLRAVAVLLVVAFHAGTPLVHGGFAGVDVFFVISGFLIGRAIADEQAAGSFSLWRFWERRVRRILPALLLMLAASAVAAWFWLLPSDLTHFAGSLLAAEFSTANILFWRTSGYFAGVMADRPLLHTWSLAVEEQFYLVFPLIMIAVARWTPTRRFTVLAALAGASFLLGLGLMIRHPEAGFYLPFARTWELLLGVLIALYRGPVPALLRKWGGVTGLVLIGVAAFVLGESTRMPGYAALLPTVGAALVILAGGEGPSGRLLAWRPMVALGLVSYSFYLLHWPMLVFQRLIAPGGQSPLATAGAVLLALLLSIITWKFVEQPFRAKVSRRTLLVTLAVTVIALSIAAGAALATRGFPDRFDPVSLKLDQRIGVLPREGFRLGTCYVSTEDRFSDYRRDLCLRRDPAREDWLLVGDSHAAHMWPGFSAVDTGVNVMQATASGCRVTYHEPQRVADGCRRMATLVYDELLERDPPDGLILSARWREASLPSLVAAIDRAKARGVKVVVIGPVPQYDDAVPRILALAHKLDDPALIDRRRLTEPRELDRRMAEVVRARGAAYVSLFDLLCEGDRCIAEIAPGVPVHFDYGHLTPEGSRLIVGRMREAGVFPPR